MAGPLSELPVKLWVYDAFSEPGLFFGGVVESICWPAPGPLNNADLLGTLVVGGLGGTIGVALGLAGAVALERFGIATAIRPEPAILAFTCALVTGLVFGYLPARQASRLDPVVALASE